MNPSRSTGGARRASHRRLLLVSVLIAVAVALVAVGVVVATTDRGDGPSGDRSAAAAGEDTGGPTLEPAPADAIPPDERTEAPDISGHGLGGDRISLAQFRGEPVVLVVFASWCEVCREEARAVAKIAKENPQVQFVGLDVEDSPQAARDFMTKYDWPPIPVIEDPDRSLAGALGLFGQPNTVAIDSKGRIAARHAGGATVEQLQELAGAART